MANEIPEPALTTSSPLSRDRLMRVLALPEQATVEVMVKATRRLVARLRHRLDRVEGEEAQALRDEIADLEASCAHWSDPSGARAGPVGSSGRPALIGALFGVAFVLTLLIAHAAGFRLTRLEETSVAAHFAEPGALILEGGVPGATLRVFDADRQELFVKMPAENARVELEEGRYALEVTRDDCPDKWTQSVYFEPGAVHQYEPDLCVGRGKLTVRSNVAGDRLKIDGVDVGATGARTHEVGVGDHDIRVEKAGFEPYEGTVRIRPDEELELRAELVSRSASRGGKPREAAAPETPVPGIAPFDPTEVEPFDLAQIQADLGLPKSGDLTRERLLRYTASGRGASPAAGGSTIWHDLVSTELLARFDLDRSGTIDRLEESEAIPCDVWREVERDFDTGGLGLSMAHYFGFDGSEWHPRALGFARELRSAVYEKMKECGLKP